MFLMQVRKWEKSLHQIFDETDVNKLSKSGEEFINKYFNSLPRPGKMFNYHAAPTKSDMSTEKSQYFS